MTTSRLQRSTLTVRGRRLPPGARSLHETPQLSCAQLAMMSVGVKERHSYHTPAAPGIGRNSSFALAELLLQESVIGREIQVPSCQVPGEVQRGLQCLQNTCVAATELRERLQFC